MKGNVCFLQRKQQRRNIKQEWKSEQTPCLLEIECALPEMLIPNGFPCLKKRRLKPVVTGHSQLSGVFCLAPSGLARSGVGWVVPLKHRHMFGSEKHYFHGFALSYPQGDTLMPGEDINSWRHSGQGSSWRDPVWQRWGRWLFTSAAAGAHSTDVPIPQAHPTAEHTHTHTHTHPLSHYPLGTRAAAEQWLVPCRQCTLSHLPGSCTFLPLVLWLLDSVGVPDICLAS